MAHDRGKSKSLGQYVLGPTLGEGTFGKVKLGTHIATNEKVAIKILEKSKIKEVADVERVSREIAILKRIRHPNVIQMFEVIDTPRQIFLIMEYSESGELFDYIVKHKRVPEPQAARFMHDICAGLDYLHSVSVIHRDLKPENLLMARGSNGYTIKVIDFGLSNTCDGGKLLKTACGSPCYAAPEMIAGHRYVGSQSDMWSLGVILFALVCGYLPFEHENTGKLYQKILNGDYTAPSFISSQAKDLIRRILETNPRRRYTMADVRAHPWYRQVTPRPVPMVSMPSTVSDLSPDVLKEVTSMGLDPKVVADAVLRSAHNHASTTYYLIARRMLRAGKTLVPGGGSAGGPPGGGSSRGGSVRPRGRDRSGTVDSASVTSTERAPRRRRASAVPTSEKRWHGPGGAAATYVVNAGSGTMSGTSTPAASVRSSRSRSTRHDDDLRRKRRSRRASAVPSVTEQRTAMERLTAGHRPSTSHNSSKPAARRSRGDSTASSKSRGGGGGDGREVHLPGGPTQTQARPRAGSAAPDLLYSMYGASTVSAATPPASALPSDEDEPAAAAPRRGGGGGRSHGSSTHGTVPPVRTSGTHPSPAGGLVMPLDANRRLAMPAGSASAAARGLAAAARSGGPVPPQAAGDTGGTGGTASAPRQSGVRSSEGGGYAVPLVPPSSTVGGRPSSAAVKHRGRTGRKYRPAQQRPVAAAVASNAPKAQRPSTASEARQGAPVRLVPAPPADGGGAPPVAPSGKGSSRPGRNLVPAEPTRVRVSLQGANTPPEKPSATSQPGSRSTPRPASRTSPRTSPRTSRPGSRTSRPGSSPRTSRPPSSGVSVAQRGSPGQFGFGRVVQKPAEEPPALAPTVNIGSSSKKDGSEASALRPAEAVM